MQAVIHKVIHILSTQKDHRNAPFAQFLFHLGEGITKHRKALEPEESFPLFLLHGGINPVYGSFSSVIVRCEAEFVYFRRNNGNNCSGK
jgi:hypothetical protein